MYNFIFYFIYKSQVNQKSGGPFVSRIIGSMIVFLALLIHCALLFSIIKYVSFNFYNIDLSYNIGSTYSSKVLFWYPLLGVAIIFLSRQYSRNRIEKILVRFNSSENFYSFKNILKFLLLIFLPLIISIFLLKNLHQ